MTTYDDVEAELLRHPAVLECAVTTIDTQEGPETLVAYVVTEGRADPAEIRRFLARPRLTAARRPRAVIPVPSLPRTDSGEVDTAQLPLPVRPGRTAGGKSGLALSDDDGLGDGGLAMILVLAASLGAIVAYVLTDPLWPGSTDLSAVPQPWAGLFAGLYTAECLSFGLGIGFLLFGYRRMARMGRPRALTVAAHLSVVWLLAAWWPQDNFYRLASKTDWERQAALVYGFNITLMIAAAVLVAFAVRERGSD
ncbi:AMP-binding enzyme [Actinomadura keratinilytica]|uniref:AMP-binding enzyme n=1 Tax=Actinomadura keratinilytica TaxID=547461 RepID=UPI0031F1B763